MLNFRTLILSIGLAAVSVLTLGLVAARTENDSHNSNTPFRVSEIQRRPASGNETYHASSYRSQYGECFDVAIRDIASCHGASQTTAQAVRAPIDECFDVSLSEVASCRKANQATAP